MSVSVLIPVYNAEAYLRQAVESALAQPETSEIVLVEDGSTDGSFALCQVLASEFSIVKVYQHPNQENRGEAASRNLLVEKASCEYLAFLDADDYFLPNRFKVALEIMGSDDSVDVVHEAHEIFYEDPIRQANYLKETPPQERLRYLSPTMEPEALFHFLMVEQNGKAGMPSLVIRKRTFAKVPRFNEALKTAPDAPMIYQLAALCRCVAGQIDQPVFMYRHHDTNLYAGTYDADSRKMKASWLAWTGYLWLWAQAELEAQRAEYVAQFLVRHCWRSAPFPSLSQMRPRRVFFKLHRLISILLLPSYYPSLNRSRSFQSALAKALVGQ